MPGYSLQTAPQVLTLFLGGLVGDLERALGCRLTAVILHGSLAMGSFYPPKSDIDLLIVVDDLSEEGRQTVYDLLALHQAMRPYAGSLEVSVIRTVDAARPAHPLPFLVHLGDNTTGPQPLLDGALPVDGDLMAHMLVALRRGVSLFGPPPCEVIGEVSWDDYLASVRADIDWLLADETVLTTPRYAVLNLCRWALMRSTAEHLIASKEEGALWALRHAPDQHRPLIGRALQVYRSSAPVARNDVPALIKAGEPWDRASLLAFRDWARALS